MTLKSMSDKCREWEKIPNNNSKEIKDNSTIDSKKRIKESVN